MSLSLVNDDEFSDIGSEPYVPTQLDRIEANTAAILTTMERIETLVTDTFTEVKPTLDGLMNHPMLKMLGMGKK
jgi:hypothetical protein